jgi:sigma-B regulation protein RsbU (phosphoserine phosphatase)
MLSVASDRSFLYEGTSGEPAQRLLAPPAVVVSRLNRHFQSNAGVMKYFTMIYGILDRESGEFRYAAAGHLGPIQVSRGAAPVIGATGGMPVGLLPDAVYEEHKMKLVGGDRLYFCTDGITEAADAGGRGRRRIAVSAGIRRAKVLLTEISKWVYY